jgi:hypothetical protein
MYDHNQRLVSDAFIAIHVRNERLTLTREELERRYELSEDLALDIAARLGAISAGQGELQRGVLEATLIGLLEPPAQVSEAEARWIVHRVVELCDWSVSLARAGWNATDEGSAGISEMGERLG